MSRKGASSPDNLPVPGAPSSDALKWEIRALELRVESGLDDLDILTALTDEGATSEQAANAYEAMMLAAGRKAATIRLETECLFGLMNARKIYIRAVRQGDIKAQIDAEKLRGAWIDKLAKLRPTPSKEDDRNRKA